MIVYKVTNTKNGKVYIGKWRGTSVLQRWRLQIAEANRGGTRYFCKAIRKYGAEAFTVEVIYQAKTDNELSKMETFFIILHQSHKPENGYNLTLGGEGVSGYNHTPEWKNAASQRMKGDKRNLGRRQSEAEREMRSERSSRHMLGKHPSQETKNKISASVSAAIMGCRNPFFGKHHSEKTKKQLSDQRKEIVPSCQMLGAKSVSGTIWTHNPSTQDSKRVKKAEETAYLLDGWLLGRGPKASESAKKRGVSAEHIRHMVERRLAKKAG
jgi:group I intron endonuclease